MKTRTKIFLFTILTLGVLVITAMEFLCGLGIKCEECTKTSISKTLSIKDGFYVTDYQPLTNSFSLAQHDEFVEFTNVWVESQWYVDSDICLLRHKEKREGFNVVFEFNKSNKNSFLFTLTPLVDGKLDKINGGIQETKKEIRILNLTDTLWLKIQEQNPDNNIGWTEEIEGQVIGFVKK